MALVIVKFASHLAYLKRYLRHCITFLIPSVYKPFSDVYGTITTVKDWPSLNLSAEKRDHGILFSPSGQFELEVGDIMYTCGMDFQDCIPADLYDKTCVVLHRLRLRISRQSALMSFVVTVAVVTIYYLQMRLKACTHFSVTGSTSS